MGSKTINTSEKARALRLRVEQAKSKLIHIGIIKSPKYYFALKFPQYNQDVDRLNNLWRGLSTDEEFTEHLESFVRFKENEYL